ncbi:hypothetical protein TCCBUS3UF1_21430 [Thermus sp. CCB_US3_UF1]|nr:hypothetical protein TCCBUS3UF1_21430 [Thermus sp. CCB_US3_UF1]
MVSPGWRHSLWPRLCSPGRAPGVAFFLTGLPFILSGLLFVCSFPRSRGGLG